MYLATKLGLAEYLEKEAADDARHLSSGMFLGTHTQQRLLKRINHFRAAAHALRSMSVEQEGAMVEYQIGGPDGVGADSYENPIQFERRKPEPPLVDMSYRSPGWYGMRDRLVASLKGEGR